VRREGASLFLLWSSPCQTVRRIRSRRIHVAASLPLRRLRGCFTLRLPVQTCVFAAGDDRVLKTRNYGTTDFSRRCPSADLLSCRTPSNISPYRPLHLPPAILYLIFNFCSVSYLLTCRLLCPQPRRHNILHELTIVDNRCVGPLTTSSPTTGSWCTNLSHLRTPGRRCFFLQPGLRQASQSP